MSCGKAQEFLERNDIEADTTVDARKAPVGRQEALKLIGDVDEIYAARGTKVVHVDLRKEPLDKDTLASLVLGPTGNLRAPAIIQGRKLIVGFNEPTYKRLLS